MTTHESLFLTSHYFIFLMFLFTEHLNSAPKHVRMELDNISPFHINIKNIKNKHEYEITHSHSTLM